MAWWVWFLIALAGVLVVLYLAGAVWYTVHVIRDPCIHVEHWYGWVVQFFIWPLSYLVEAAVGGMLM